MNDSNRGLNRRSSDRVVAGVAGGLADSLGVDDSYVRAGFITMATVWGLGGLVYGLLWAVTFDSVGDRTRREIDGSQRFGLGLAFVGLMAMLGFTGMWPSAVLVVTAATLSFGMAFVTDHTNQRPLAALLNPDSDRSGGFRLVVGGMLLVGGLIIFATTVGPVFELGAVFAAVLFTVLGVLIAFGPAVRRLIGDLASERSERIRQEERAEVAAHLHDSVLQTLALIQRTEDPARMNMLARHQETELRDWLYGNAPLDGVDLMSTALRQAALKIEEDHGVPVDVVTVGDHPVDENSRALVGAASEALVNAAKHSGAGRISLYFEATLSELTVYVTDQGKGFDPTSVPVDRKGITGSIKARVEKVGGSVDIVSEAGEGTEVILSMALERK